MIEIYRLSPSYRVFFLEWPNKEVDYEIKHISIDSFPWKVLLQLEPQNDNIWVCLSSSTGF